MKLSIKNVINNVCLPFYYFFLKLLSRWKIYKAIETDGDIFLELGAGNKKGRDGWLTIDITQHCDIFWDLSKGIPFPTNSVAKIYSSHFFEHLTFREINILLQDCMRVLAPNGIFSICVPNAKMYIEAYLEKIPAPKEAFGYISAYNNTTRIDFINYIAYMDGHHKYMFDEENLLFVLKSSGMKNVRLRSFDPDLDSKERSFESIYAVAQK